MTDKKTEALKLAQEAIDDRASLTRWKKARDAIREALADHVPDATKMIEQPAQHQEPVAVIRSVVHSGYDGVRVTWLGGFPQIGDLLYTAPPASKPHEQHEPVACKTLCELCVKRGYHFCANAAQTTPIPSPPASKPWRGLTLEDKQRVLDGNFGGSRADCMDEAEKILRERNA